MPPASARPLRNGARRAASDARRGHGEAALSALAALSDAVGLLDRDGRILVSNATFDALVSDGPTWPQITAALREGGSATRDVTLADGRVLGLSVAPTAQGALVTLRDMSKRRAEHSLASNEARTDALTELGNRLRFREGVDEMIAGRSADDPPVAVIAIDLDRFKAVNDTLGHPVGDKLLRAVADRLRKSLRKGDLAARLGGDEFAVAQCGHPQPDGAAAAAKRLVDLLGRSYIVDGHLINIGASVGVAFAPGDANAYDDLIRSADLALYRAKKEGRGAFRFFEPAMDEAMQARRSLELDLRRALALRELSLVYQPQINLATKQITGFEALLRWTHPTRGSVSPTEFIPLAEEIGVITMIGEWVIRSACREAVKWAQPLCIAVNVSAVQFAGDRLVPIVVSALAESGLDPRRLELEITESVLLADHRAALTVLNQVRELGVRVSMDDFGTGYSSLSYLRSFPFDKIKIDQSFVRGHDGDPSAIAIIRAIAALGQSLGMTTTAEGVETAEQLADVIAHGCTDVQGFLISKPISPDEIIGFLSAQAAQNA